MKILWRLLLALVLLLPAILFLAVSTELGTRTLLSSLARLMPLEIDYAGGTLTEPLHLKRLRYKTDSLRLELNDVVAELEPECLWRGIVCLRQLQAQRVDLTLGSGASSESANIVDGDPTHLMEFPVPVEVDTLLVDATLVQWSGGEWRAGPTQGRVRLTDSRIQVSAAVMEQTRLVLVDPVSVNAPPVGPRALSSIELPLELNVAGLQLVDPQWDFYGSRHRQDSISVAGRWLRSNLHLAHLAIEDVERGNLSLQGELNFSGDWPLQANADLDLAQPPPWMGTLGRHIRVAATGSLQSLALQLSLSGTVDVALQGLVNVLDPLLPFSASLTATSADTLSLADIEGMPPGLEDGQLDFPLVASASGSLAAQEFEIQAMASGFGYKSLQFSLQGMHDKGEIVIESMAAIDSSGSNGLHGSGKLSLSEHVEWSLALQSSGMALPQLNENIHGTLAGSLSLNGVVFGDDWEVAIADVDLQGEVNELPAAISGFAGLNSTLRLTNSDLKATLNGARFSLRTSPETDAPGQLELRVDDLGRWSPGNQGQLQLQALVSADHQRVEVSASAHRVAWAGMQVEDAALAGTFQADDDQSFTVDARLSQISWRNFALSSLEMSAVGDNAGQTFSLTSQGDVQGKLSMVGTAFSKKWQGILSPSRLQTPRGDWELTEAVELAWSGDTRQLSLDTHCWRYQLASVCPQNWVLGEQGSGSLGVSGDMTLLSGLFLPGINMGGDLQLQLDARWNPDAGVTFDGLSKVSALTLTQPLGEGESAIVDWDLGEVNFHYASEVLQLDASLERAGRQVMGVKLEIAPDGNGPLAGSVNFDQLQLEALGPLMPAFATVAGDVSGRVSLSGSLERPLGRGVLSLSGGRLALAGNPTELDKLDLTLDVNGDRAQLRGGGLLGGGELQIAGQFKTSPDYRLELTLRGDNHTLLYPPSTELQVSEDLHLVAVAGLTDITGKITVHSGILKFEQLPDDSVAVSSSVVEVDYAGNVVKEELPFDLSMDVRVHVLEHLTITGSNLQATLGGDLHLLQQPGRPLQLFGQLSTFGGQLRAYQQRLAIRRGRLSFSGPPTNPNIDVSAEREIVGGDVTVGVRVQGPLQEDLLLDIYSNPPMSQPDAISYLVRGRPVDTGVGADGTALALSLASGVVNRSSLVSELNRIPGISNVEFGAQGSEDDTAATLSGYIGERIYLSYGFGLYEPVNVLTARFYLSARLWLEVVSSLENSADLYYSFDID